MEMTPTISKLAEALAKAQGEIEGARKDSTNPHFKSKYADLESTWAACRKPLSKHGLSVVQMPFDNDGRVGIETMLLHESGEWIKGIISVKASQEANPQIAGSILTYLRRYSLQGAVGIAPEDDDGNAGAGGNAGEQVEETGTGDPAVIKTFADAKTMDEVSKAWNAIPVNERRNYTAAKDAAKARVAKGQAA